MMLTTAALHTVSYTHSAIHTQYRTHIVPNTHSTKHTQYQTHTVPNTHSTIHTLTRTLWPQSHCGLSAGDLVVRSAVRCAVRSAVWVAYTPRPGAYPAIVSAHRLLDALVTKLLFTVARSSRLRRLHPQPHLLYPDTHCDSDDASASWS